ncbi:hypothetical protein C8J57DRAFT_1543236 [Mycena rebaudengoi]|nr:hypothetical protein C8J57DRAFT_1543236 [Mycena rebaudengoi]
MSVHNWVPPLPALSSYGTSFGPVRMRTAVDGVSDVFVYQEIRDYSVPTFNFSRYVNPWQRFCLAGCVKEINPLPLFGSTHTVFDIILTLPENANGHAIDLFQDQLALINAITHRDRNDLPGNVTVRWKGRVWPTATEISVRMISPIRRDPDSPFGIVYSERRTPSISLEDDIVVRASLIMCRTDDGPDDITLGGYAYQGPQYITHPPPPPTPYIPAAQFYGHMMPYHAPDAPAPPARKRAVSLSPSKSATTSLPKKRGRGRPRGSVNKIKPLTRATAKAKKATAAAKPVKQKKAAKENVSSVTLELSDTDNEIEKTVEGKLRYWDTNEKTLFFQFLLRQDEVGDKRFKQHKKNPGHVYKRASELIYEGSRTAESIKSMYTRALETFTWMLTFESFTGNGGGDPDSDDPTAILKSRLAAARRSGLHVGSLKPATITEWEDNGWRDLFSDRLGASAKDNGDGNDSDTDGKLDPVLLAESCAAASAPVVPKTPAATVSEPKHTPSSNFRKQTNHSFGNIGEFMKMKMLSEEKKTHALDEKLKLEREKSELDKAKAKVDMARNVFAMPGASDEVKEAANAYLLSVFT